jgi:prepilin-type N-terminal cleavage/methylation domain-containing protein
MRRLPLQGRQAGFTLLELMIALGVFVLLGVALVKLVHKSFDFLDQGRPGSEITDQLQVFQAQFNEDLRSVFTLRRTPEVAPDVRMICRTVPWRIERETGSGRSRTSSEEVVLHVPILAFVRSIKGEERDSITRLAGTRPGAEAYLDLDDDEREARSGKLRPLGGLQEVLYAAIPSEDDGGATWSIVRAIRSPIGGEDSLLGPNVLKDRTDLLTRHCVELLPAVLHFDLLFWAGTTMTWDLSVRGDGGGPLTTWDSTRGILTAERGPNAFPLAVGVASLENPRDDVFPRRILARLVLAAPGRGGRFARLTDGISNRDDEQFLSLAPPNLVPATVADNERFLKVGAEWIEYVGRPDPGRFSISGRGARGTPRLSHARSDRVVFGQTEEVLVSIPAFREEKPR